MASLESIPPDQRALLQLVLAQDRGYDEIAKLLSIDRVGVRERALEAFDALGPRTPVAAQQRALVTDYLLGQLPSRVSEEVHARLAESADERGWARAVAAELAPMASRPLPEIPPGPSGAESEPGLADEPDFASAGEPEPGARESERDRAPEPESAVAQSEQPAPAATSRSGPGAPKPAGAAPSARSGGCILLALGALIVVVVVVVAVATSGSGTKHTPSKAARPASTSTAPARAPVLGRIALVPFARGSKALGAAIVLRQAGNDVIVLEAQGLAPTRNFLYAVWLYSSGSENEFVGFVHERVGADGKLSTRGTLPANVARYRQLLVTVETQAQPHGPGSVVLHGALKLT